MTAANYRVVLDTNQVVGAGTGWLDHGVPVPDKNVYRRVLIRVAETHTGLYCGKVVGEYLEKLVDLRHPLVVRLGPGLGDEADLPALNDFEGRPREGFHAYEPLT